MAQSPFLADQLQIEPGSPGTRLVNMSAGGELQFQDPDIAAVLLRNLLGTRNITGVYVVGSGDGAAYATVQSAFDAIPNSSSSSSPSVVLIYPGTYTENLTLQKDGVYVLGVGEVTLENSGASDTLTISASLDVTPRDLTLEGLEISNVTAAQACVNVVGADTFATGMVTVARFPLAAGDTLTIGGVVLTGIAGTRTPGSNNFNVLGSSASAVAAEISAALNDSANSFAASVRATPAGADVTIDAVAAGSGGNAITLVASTTPPAGLTLSGATLTGGGSSGSLVAADKLLIKGCTLAASGVAAYQLKADVCGVVEVRGGTWRGSDNASLASVSNCSRFRLVGVEWVNDIEVAYDTTADRPSDATCEYLISGVSRIGGVLSNLAGAGTLTLSNCPSMTSLNQTGDQALAVKHSSVGALTLGGTTAAVLAASTRSSVAVSAGTPTLAEPKITDTLTFAAVDTESYAFAVTQPDAAYTVLLESPTTATVLAVANKTVTGFDVVGSVVFSGTVGLSIVRA